MNRLKYINAIAHPLGNRVDIRWLNPNPIDFTGVRVVRRENTHPTSITDGQTVDHIPNNFLFSLDPSYGHHLDTKVVSSQLSVKFISHQYPVSTDAVVSVIVPGNRWEIAEEDDIYYVYRDNALLNVYGFARVSDMGLASGRVLYYTLFPYSGTDAQNLKYDFTQTNRVTCFATDSTDYAERMYNQLPVIYHRYDTRVPLAGQADKAGMDEADRQKGQLRRFLDITGSHFDQLHSFTSAALNLHDMNRVDGNLLPLLGRWIGWNRFFSTEVSGQRNEVRYAPELFQTIGQIPTIETIVRLVTGMENQTREMASNVVLTNKPEELNFWLAYRDDKGKWTSEKTVFSLDFAFEGRPSAVRDETNTLWLFYHTRRNNDWDIWYKTFREDHGWTPSKPLTGIPNIDKHPGAALLNNTLIVYWNSFDQVTQAWSIKYREHTGGTWSENATFDHDIPENTQVERKCPYPLVTPDNKLWLFYFEKNAVAGDGNDGNDSDEIWKLKVNRFDGSDWETAVDFPLDGVIDPRVDTDFCAVIRTVGTVNSIVLSWSRKQINANGKLLGKELVLREKTGIASLSGGWGPLEVLSKVAASYLYHDAEPYMVGGNNGVIDLYWSSNRSGSYSIWNMNFADLASISPGAAVKIVSGLYSQRNPIAFPTGSGSEMILVYRSNQGIAYQGAVFRASSQVDFRRAGSIAVDTRDRQTTVRNGKFNDCFTYTYDTGDNGTPTEDTWYACDTVGIYLTADSEDIEATLKKIKTLQSVIGQFMPLHTRAVCILRPFITQEAVYNYDLPPKTGENPVFIKEIMNDFLHEKPRTEVLPVMSESYTDTPRSWTLLKSWSAATSTSKSADFSITPPDTASRSWHVALNW